MNVVSYLAFAHVFGRLLKVPTMTVQFFPPSSGSGLSTLLFCAVMLISPVSALLQWDFVCNFRAIKRYKLGTQRATIRLYMCAVLVHKGPSCCNRRIADLRSLLCVLSCRVVVLRWIVRPNVPVFRM